MLRPRFINGSKGQPDIYWWLNGPAKDCIPLFQSTVKKIWINFRIVQCAGTLRIRIKTSYRCVFSLQQTVAVSRQNNLSMTFQKLWPLAITYCDGLPAAKVCFYDNKIHWHGNKWSPVSSWIIHIQSFAVAVPMGQLKISYS